MSQSPLFKNRVPFGKLICLGVYVPSSLIGNTSVEFFKWFHVFYYCRSLFTIRNPNCWDIFGMKLKKSGCRIFLSPFSSNEVEGDGF